MKFSALLRSMRPHQWAKNALLFAPLLFARQLTNTKAVMYSAMAFAVFCILAGSVYILNDSLDYEKDKLHPKKKYRPIASGDFPIEIARWAWIVLAAIALTLSAFININLLWVGGTYLLFNIAYCLKLKHVPYVDVLILSSGFVLRVMAGGAAANITLTYWLFTCTFLLALYLALGKRRHELSTHGEQASKQRKVLESYDVKQLDLMLCVVASLTALAYCGYTLDPSTKERFGTLNLIYTIPFVVFSIVRFLQLIEYGAKTESPTQELLRDIPSLANVLVYISVVVYIIYG